MKIFYQKNSPRIAVDIVLNLIFLTIPFITVSFNFLLATIFSFTFGGLGLLRCWLFAHEAGHKNLSKSKLSNDLMGSLFSLPTLYPYFSLAKAHGFHHSHLSIVGKDTTWTPWTDKKWEKMPHVIRRLYTFVRGKGLFFGSIFHLFVFHFATKEIGLKNSPVVIIQKLLSLFLVVSFLVYSFIHPIFMILVFWIPHFGFHSLLSLISYIQHTYPKTVDKPAKLWSYGFRSNSTTSVCDRTIDWRFPRLFEFLIMNINRHTAHHIDPSIRYQDLPEASHALKEEKKLDERRFNLTTIFTIFRGCILIDGNEQWLNYNLIKKRKLNE